MRKKLKLSNLFLSTGLFILFTMATLSCSSAQNPIVEISTDLGKFKVEIYKRKAPITASNFLDYVDNHLFDGSFFYRIVTKDNDPEKKIKIAVIQGGLSGMDGKKRFPPIKHETTEKTGILHREGIISMARNEPGTASSEFFICIGDQPELDFGGQRNPDGQGFSAFGKVIEGMDVIKSIHSQPADGQYLHPKIKIHYIKRL